MAIAHVFDVFDVLFQGRQITIIMFCKALVVFCMLYLHATNAVTELDDNSFFNYASKKQVLLVNFYAPW